MNNCKFYGKELSSGHRCPSSCPLAQDCQEAYETWRELKVFKDVGITDILPKFLEVIAKRNEPGYGQVATLGIEENGARMVVYHPQNNKLCLRLEYDGHSPLDSRPIFEYFNNDWHLASRYIQAIVWWLDKVKEL